MNEDSYFAEVQPQVLLERLRPTERQRRLIVCACFRFLRDELGDAIPLANLEQAERFSEGRDALPPSPLGTLLALPADRAAIAAIRGVTSRLPGHHKSQLADTLDVRAAPALERASRASAGVAASSCKAVERRFRRRDANQVERRVAADRRRLCDLIRDVMGNPYRAPVVRTAWLDANRKLVRAVAEEIDATGHYDEVPVLADALEEAGCTDAKMLAHARQARHYRGCWLIEAVVGRA